MGVFVSINFYLCDDTILSVGNLFSSDVFAHFYKKAKASVHFDDYCKNYVPYDTSDFVSAKK